MSSVRTAIGLISSYNVLLAARLQAGQQKVWV